MQLTVIEHTWIVDNPEENASASIQRINEVLKQSNLHYSHMIVDGTEVYDSYETFLSDLLEPVKEVKIVARTYRELKDDMLTSLSQYLDRAVPKIEQLSEGLYQGADEDTWGQFALLAEALDWVLQVLPNLASEQEAYANRQAYADASNKLAEHVVSLTDALESRDTTLMGDIIQYEIFPLLNHVMGVVKETLGNEVANHDTN